KSGGGGRGAPAAAEKLGAQARRPADGTAAAAGHRIRQIVTRRLPIARMIDAMTTRRNRGAQAALLSLEADAVSARGGFACVFSTADEYESALIAERRAQGRYRAHSPWPMIMLGCALAMMGTALLWR